MGRAPALVAFVALVHPLVAACNPRDCVATDVPYSQGEMLDPDTFETNPLDSPTEPWIDYPGNVTLRFTYPADAKAAIGGRRVAWIDGYVGISAHPNAGNDNWTGAEGQLAEMSDVGPAGFAVTNASCANYFARFVVHFAPADAGAPDAAE